MKKIVLCLFVAAWVLPLPAKSIIKFKSLAVDFGQVESGKVVAANFEFENGGDSVLLIRNVIPSCGCTTLKMTKNEYKPGEKGVIPANFNSTGYRGNVIKTLTVLSNDPASPEVLLRITGKVSSAEYAEAEIKPDKVAFGKVALGKTVSQKVHLSNRGTIPLQIIEIASGPEIHVVAHAKSVAPKKSGELEIFFTAFEKGQFSNLVRIQTNEEQRVAYIRVDAEVD